MRSLRNILSISKIVKYIIPIDNHRHIHCGARVSFTETRITVCCAGIRDHGHLWPTMSNRGLSVLKKGSTLIMV